MLRNAFAVNQRTFLNQTGLGLGGIALANLLRQEGAAETRERDVLGQPHHPPKAKRIIYLFMSGAPSQLDLLDYKPELKTVGGAAVARFRAPRATVDGHVGKPIVDSACRFAVRVPPTRSRQVRGSANCCPTRRASPRNCASSVRCTRRRSIMDRASRSCKPGTQIAGRPSMGAWLSYGLGQENANLPAFVVLITKDKGGQPLGSGRVFSGGAGFCLRSIKAFCCICTAQDPVLYLGNPAGIDRDSRRQMLDRLRELHEHQLEGTPDAEIRSRIEHYELAFAMQASVPEAADLSQESQAVLDSYGPDVTKPGTFAANCLLARRLAERGVQLHPVVPPGLGPSRWASRRAFPICAAKPISRPRRW